MEAQNDSNSNISAYNNIGFQMAGALQIRLNTDPILMDIYYYLTGLSVKVVEDNNGNPVETLVQESKPIANQYGVRRIMDYLKGVFNPQVVQGNFSEEMYNHYLYKHRKALAIDVVLNITRYGINPDDVNGLMDRIFSMIEPFLSRTLGNKERESYAQTIKSVESNTSQLKTGRSGFNPLNYTSMGGSQ